MLFPPSRVGPARHSAEAHLCPSGQCRPGPGFSLGKHTTDLIEKEMLVFAWTREWALALVVLASVGAAGCGYNTIQTYDEQVTAAGSQIKSNENFRALQDQLEGTENRIAVARQDYNEAVNRYNAYIRRFPQVLTAKLLGKGPRPYFELETPGAAQAPKVDFSK